MKNKVYLLFISIAVLSCKKKNDPEPIPESFPSVVTGKLYGTSFTTKVSMHKNTNFYYDDYKVEDLFNIYLSADGTKSCTNENKEFSVRFTVPRKVGIYTYIPLLVKDPNDPTGNDGFLIYSSSSMVEITAITAEKITGKATLIDNKLNTNTSIKGNFEASICK
ncbi:hypothetical protein ACVWYG_002028 [Pedobacter sp. UYEF25]